MIRLSLLSLLLICVGVASADAQSVWDGVYTEAQAERGKAIYETECVLCHGASLLGAEDGPAVTGEFFIEGWDGSTADELVELIRVTMPTDGPGFLSRAQSTDLSAYIFQDNGFPAGESEMKPSLAALKEIVIEAKKQ